MQQKAVPPAVLLPLLQAYFMCLNETRVWFDTENEVTFSY